MDSRQIGKAVYRWQARIAAMESRASLWGACKVRRWEPQAVKLPVTVQRFLGLWVLPRRTIRELGKTFQLSRRPSRSSISDHCSFSASMSMMSEAQSPGPRWLVCLLAWPCGRGVVQYLGRWAMGPGAQVVRRDVCLEIYMRTISWNAEWC